MHRVLQRLGHCRRIPFGIRDRIIRAIAPPNAAGRDFTVPFFGQLYAGNLSSFIDWSVYFYGAYEGALLGFLRDCASSGTVFADIGANTGHHTLFMAGRVKQVHAFEPWQPVRERLEARIALNRLRNVTVHPLGLGRDDAALPFAAPGGGKNAGQGTFRTDPGFGDGELLPVANGDRYFTQHGIAPDLMKIDVEGLEPDVLAGLTETIARCRPVIVAEWSPWSRNAGDPADALPHGYRTFGLVNRGDRPYRLEPYDSARHYELVLAPEEARVPMTGPSAAEAD